LSLVATGVCHTDYRAEPVSRRYACCAGDMKGQVFVERSWEPCSVKVKPGDHVVLSYLFLRGTVSRCQQGKYGYCQHFDWSNFCRDQAGWLNDLSRQDDMIIHGSFFGQSSFATYALATERNVVKVRADVPLSCLALLGCGIQDAEPEP